MCAGRERRWGFGCLLPCVGAALRERNRAAPQCGKAEKGTHREGCSDACRAVGPIGSPYREPTEDLHGQRFHFVSCALF